MDVLTEAEQILVLDQFYWSAENSAHQLGMPCGDTDVWAYLWTQAEVRQGTGTVEVLAMLRNGGPNATAMRLPFKEVSAAEGFCFKMLGQVVSEPTATTWAISVSPDVGGFVLIEPWYMVVPIGDGAAWLKRMPDGRRLIGDEVSPDVADATRASARRALAMTPKHAGGRHKGYQKGQVWSTRENAEWWIAWDLDRDPKPEDYAAEIGVKDPETALKRWRSSGLDWPPTTAQLNEFGDE